MNPRIIHKGIVTHCYQRSVGGGLLFYDDIDHLAYFTAYCCYARAVGITVLGMCQMPDHTHDSIVADSVSQLASFKRDHNSFFALKQNEFIGMEGPVFQHPYGSAVKIGPKKARSNLIYVGNNPVERQLVLKAEDYRWNYIAYARSEHPFSEKLRIGSASWPMRVAVKEVKALNGLNLPMTHCRLKRLFKPLDAVERSQLTDFIICTYNVICYDAALEFFDGSYSNYLMALHSTTGSEYDLNELFVGRSDVYYDQMTTLLMSEYNLNDIHHIFKMDRQKLFEFLRIRTEAPSRQILKYLRLCP